MAKFRLSGKSAGIEFLFLPRLKKGVVAPYVWHIC